MRDLVEDGAVALVADAGQDRHGTQADEAGELVVVEPGEVVDGAAAADDDDRIGQIARPTRPPATASITSRIDAGGAVALEAAVRVDGLAEAVALQPVGVAREVAQAGRARRRDDEQDAVVPRRRQLPVALEDALGLQLLADLALLRLEVAERVARVDRVDVQRQAVLGTELGLAPGSAP